MSALRIHVNRNMDILSARYICIYLVMDAVNSILQDVFHLAGSGLLAGRVLLAGIAACFMLAALSRMTKKEWKRFIRAELFLLAACLYSVLAGTTVPAVMGWAGDIFLVCVPLAVLASCIQDKSVLYGMLRKVSWILLALYALDMIGQTGSNYDHHFSYGLLLVLLIHLNELFRGNNRLLILVIAAELIMLLAYGTRGAVFSVAVFMVFKLASRSGHPARRYVLMVILMAAALLLYLYSEELMVGLYQILAARGFQGRTLRLLLSGKFLSHDSGRMELWRTVLQLIREKPVIGWGMRGAVSRMGHPYPHNLFLDLVLSFGIPAGLVLSVCLLLPLRKVLLTKEQTERDLLHIFFCSSFIMLMFSSTLFTNHSYYLLMGLAVSAGQESNHFALRRPAAEFGSGKRA